MYAPYLEIESRFGLPPFPSEAHKKGKLTSPFENNFLI